MKWTMKPITWGAYAKLCAVSTAISVVVCAICWLDMCYGSVEDFFKKLFRKKS